MSADRLREAARVLRERAEAATRGPWNWECYREDLPSLLGLAGTPGVYEWRQEVIEADHSGECGCRSACYLTLGVDPADQTYIATMHPGVGLALADLLDVTARHVSSHDCEARCEYPDGCDMRKAAERIADLVLWEER